MTATAFETIRYRWVVLAVGTAAQATTSAVFLGIAVLAPQLRSRFGLAVGETGVVLAAVSIGMTPTLLAWGVLTDRVGERLVLPAGLTVAAGALAGAAFVDDYGSLLVLLIAVGAFGASVNAASGRVVMHWFPRQERGLALGIRQANVPLGGLLAALALPPLTDASGVRGAFLTLAICCGVGAAVAAVLLRDPPAAESHPASRPLRSPAVWRVSAASGLIAIGQTATMSFTVLYLHNAHGFSAGSAAAVLAGEQVLGAGFRVLAGHWSDRVGARIWPIRRLTLAIAGTLAVVAGVDGSPSWLLVTALVAAGSIGLSWNGLAYTLTAEIAGARASGAALGLQQTVLGVAGVVAPIGIAGLASAASWRTAFLGAALFPILGWITLRPLSGR